jgi:hypothetical protein
MVNGTIAHGAGGLLFRKIGTATIIITPHSGFWYARKIDI